jgi:trehalose 6-phosphate phosphatase
MMADNRSAAGDTFDVGIPGFWDEVASASSAALLLDYDGTLAPFHVDRLQAYPTDGVFDALRTLAESSRTIVALVSGRPVEELLTLMPDPGVTIIGTHGYEVRHPEQPIRTTAISETQADQLDRALKDAHRLVGKARSERKVATVAAHFRGLDRQDARDVQQDLLQRWLSYADTAIVEVRQFNGGLEMRALGRHKGVAVAEFLETCPADTLAVYVGDDDTDEDAFSAVRERNGHGIRVGGLNSSTLATGSIESCDDVPRFLQTWIGARHKP